MKRFAGIVMTLFALLAATSAMAQVQTYAVLPFEVNGPEKYAYLSQGIQEMLTSRLHWKNKLQPVNKDRLAGVAGPDSTVAADSIREDLQADYLVWGALTVMGDDGSLDVQVKGDKPEPWFESQSMPLAELIPRLEQTAKRINADIFDRPDVAGPEASQSATAPKEQVQALNPGLVYNQSRTDQEVVLNPQFKYEEQTDAGGRLQSRRLPFASRAMRIHDLDSDGTKEVLLLDDHNVRIFHFQDSNLVPVAEYAFAPMQIGVYLSVLDVNRDGLSEIFVVTCEENEGKKLYQLKDPRTYVLNYGADKITAQNDNVKLFMNVVSLPPDYMPTLIAQKPDRNGLFAKGVFEVVKNGGEYQPGKRISLPEKANVFNFTYLPDKKGHKIAVIDDSDRLLVYNHNNERQYSSDEKYSGSAVGLFYGETMPGLGASKFDLEDVYYLAMRTLATDLEKDGQYELLVNKPISVSAQFFERYRYYPQGEIHSLRWDGVGMSLVWKTRRIKGTVVDFSLTDIDNDGGDELVVCINTHPGALGLDSRRTMLIMYPLQK